MRGVTVVEYILNKAIFSYQINTHSRMNSRFILGHKGSEWVKISPIIILYISDNILQIYEKFILGEIKNQFCPRKLTLFLGASDLDPF